MKSAYIKKGLDGIWSELAKKYELGIEQLISELKGIEQVHIDANPECFRTMEFINRLTVRLNEIIE